MISDSKKNIISYVIPKQTSPYMVTTQTNICFFLLFAFGIFPHPLLFYFSEKSLK